MALSEVERQPLKPARCRTLLQPGANLVAHAGAPRAGSQESVPRRTRARKRGIHAWLSAASGNVLQKPMLGTSSEILSEVVSGNAVVSVNSVN